MITDFEGRVAVVTGGASGIGYALAAQLRAMRAQVVLADCESGALESAAGALGATPVLADVARPESVEALVRTVLERFGQVDLLCNNAGVSAMAGVERLSLDDFRWVMDVNFFGVVHGVKAFLPALKANPRGGHILNTASLNGLLALPALGAYAASKYAVVGLSEALRLELDAEGGRVGVTVLCPGPVRTNIRFSARNRGSGYGPTGRREGDPDLHERAFRATVDPEGFIEAEVAAAAALEAVKAGRFWALTQPELMDGWGARQAEIVQALELAPSARRP